MLIKSDSSPTCSNNCSLEIKSNQLQLTKLSPIPILQIPASLPINAFSSILSWNNHTGVAHPRRREKWVRINGPLSRLSINEVRKVWRRGRIDFRRISMSKNTRKAIEKEILWNEEIDKGILNKRGVKKSNRSEKNNS